ncbi:MAG TPA: hypothetical protein VND94_21495 [Terriglobia bacterium]|nr:hypothetical protein [Terriglobia bacterium]
MTSFTFTLEELLAAPVEVRRWAEQRIGAALAELGRHPAARGNGGTILPYHAATEYPLQRIAMQQPLLTSAARAMPPFEAARAAESGNAAKPAHAAEDAAPSAGTASQPAGEEPGAQSPAIAACSAEEAVRLFSQLQDDLPTAQVFFELGRETAVELPHQALAVFTISDIMRHARLSDGRQLLACLKRINQVFQRLRGAADLSLFGIDASGYLYVHATTHRSIHRLWTDLLAMDADQHQDVMEGRPA